MPDESRPRPGWGDVHALLRRAAEDDPVFAYALVKHARKVLLAARGIERLLIVSPNPDEAPIDRSARELLAQQALCAALDALDDDYDEEADYYPTFAPEGWFPNEAARARLASRTARPICPDCGDAYDPPGIEGRCVGCAEVAGPWAKCVVCREADVCVAAGFDTCAACARRT